MNLVLNFTYTIIYMNIVFGCTIENVVKNKVFKGFLWHKMKTFFYLTTDKVGVNPDRIKEKRKKKKNLISATTTISEHITTVIANRHFSKMTTIISMWHLDIVPRDPYVKERKTREMEGLCETNWKRARDCVSQD